jgi:hypothetical protein
MPGQLYRGASLACLIVVLLASCGEHKSESGAVWAIRAGVPPALQKIAERAEAIIATVPTGDWPRIYAYSREIKDAWIDYKNPTVSAWSARFRPPAVIFVQELDAAVAALYDAQAARDAAGTLRAANDISASALDLSEYYHPSVPPNLRTLTVLQRRVMTAAAAGDLDDASQTLDHLDLLWQRLRPTLQDRTDAEVIRALENGLAAQRAALATGDQEVLIANAQSTLNLMNWMQQAY